LRRRGSIALPTEVNGVRQHAAIDPADIAASSAPRLIIRHNVGLTHVHANGRIRRVTRAETAAWNAEHPECECVDCKAARSADPEVASLHGATLLKWLADPATGDERADPYDTDDAPTRRRERVL
jgi:hypothetical protein